MSYFKTCKNIVRRSRTNQTVIVQR